MAKTLLRAAAVLALVTVAVFFLIRLVPGDPAKMILGQYATEGAIQAMRDRLGLDLPVGQQFGNFLHQVFTTGDTGPSLVYNVPSRDLVAARAPVTLLLVVMASLLTVILSLVLATLAATHKDTLVDHILRVLPALALGMPVFWIGLLLILLFGVTWHIFPVGGVPSGPWGLVYGLTLPAITVALAQTPALIRSLRTQILEVLESDFVLTLRAAGLPHRVILYRHVLRNAAVPALMLWGVNVSYLMGGTLVIEQVFGLKGVGSLLFSAIANRDFPLIQAVALYCALAVVLVGLVTEVLTHRLDPRTRGAR